MWRYGDDGWGGIGARGGSGRARAAGQWTVGKSGPVRAAARRTCMDHRGKSKTALRDTTQPGHGGTVHTAKVQYLGKEAGGEGTAPFTPTSVTRR